MMVPQISAIGYTIFLTKSVRLEVTDDFAEFVTVPCVWPYVRRRGGGQRRVGGGGVGHDDGGGGVVVAGRRRWRRGHFTRK